MPSNEQIRLDCTLHQGDPDVRCYATIQKQRTKDVYIIGAANGEKGSEHRVASVFVDGPKLRRAVGFVDEDPLGLAIKCAGLEQRVQDAERRLRDAQRAENISRNARREAQLETENQRRRADAAEAKVRELEAQLAKLKPFEPPTEPGAKFRAKWRNKTADTGWRTFTTYADGNGSAVYSYDSPEGYRHTRNAHEVMSMYVNHEMVEE